MLKFVACLKLLFLAFVFAVMLGINGAAIAQDMPQSIEHHHGGGGHGPCGGPYGGPGR